MSVSSGKFELHWYLVEVVRSWLLDPREAEVTDEIDTVMEGVPRKRAFSSDEQLSYASMLESKLKEKGLEVIRPKHKNNKEESGRRKEGD